ncbi:MAG: hypothetical protein AAF218_11020 [Pseudomonadota bacterium]
MARDTYIIRPRTMARQIAAPSHVDRIHHFALAEVLPQVVQRLRGPHQAAPNPGQRTVLTAASQRWITPR